MRDVHADTSLVSRHVDLDVFVCSPFRFNFLCFCWDSGTKCCSGCNFVTGSFIVCVCVCVCVCECVCVCVCVSVCVCV